MCGVYQFISLIILIERIEVSDRTLIELVCLPVLPTHSSAHTRLLQGPFSTPVFCLHWSVAEEVGHAVKIT